MHDLNDTLIFAKVVEHGSFIGAARSLRLPKTTVSRKVQNLETRLGAQLLRRTTRKLGLTETGNIYYEHCRHIARNLDEAERAVGRLQETPRGWLRFTAPYSLGIAWIAPLLRDFHALYPEVRTDIVLTNETLDLIDKEIDLALRIGNLPDSNLAARRLTVFRSQIYASPTYLARCGEPPHPEDLRHHHTLVMHQSRRNGGYVWPLSDGKRRSDFTVEPILVANDPAPLRSALLGGEGLMLASDAMVKIDAAKGGVRRVLSDWTGPAVDFNAVFARGASQSPKVRAFIDFLVERINFEADYRQALSLDYRCPDKATEPSLATADAILDAPTVASTATHASTRASPP
ncbi:MAG: LysR family transcriptional regulator [Candidatus Competibacteraceae bacterium]|nr:LysR family transcriptional regulator [Candidatus Competibacteraceae bacterium]